MRVKTVIQVTCDDWVGDEIHDGMTLFYELLRFASTDKFNKALYSLQGEIRELPFSRFSREEEVPSPARGSVMAKRGSLTHNCVF